MKSITLAFAAILATTSAAWATTAPDPLSLTYSQIADIIRHADGDPHTIPGFISAHVVLDLRPIPDRPYYAVAGSHHGIAFICQTAFEDYFGGGPVTATLVEYERGEDGRDFVKLNGCTPQER